jgi:hypothetical protein
MTHWESLYRRKRQSQQRLFIVLGAEIGVNKTKKEPYVNGLSLLSTKENIRNAGLVINARCSDRE